MITPDEADRLRILGDHITESQLDGASLINRVAADAEAATDFVLWFEIGNQIHIEPTRRHGTVVVLYQLLWFDQRRGRVTDRFEHMLSWQRIRNFHHEVVQLMLGATELVDVNQYRDRLPQHRRPYESLDARRARYHRTQQACGNRRETITFQEGTPVYWDNERMGVVADPNNHFGDAVRIARIYQDHEVPNRYLLNPPVRLPGSRANSPPPSAPGNTPDVD